MDGEHWTGLAIAQPTRKREWELRRGNEVVAELQLPALKGGGRGTVAGREVEIRSRGVFRPEHVVADRATGEVLARVRRSSVDLVGLEHAEWTSLGRKAGHGFVGEDGEPWLRGKVSSGTFRTTGQIEVAPGHDAVLPALLAAYLLIRKAEQAAGASGAVVAAT